MSKVYPSRNQNVFPIACRLPLVFTCIFSWICLVNAKEYLFDRAICTGMGDRVGTMLTLAALAHLEGDKVVFWWCDDPSEIMSRMHPAIPKWHGYNYSLAEFKQRFYLPNELILVSRVTDEYNLLPRVQWNGVGLPAEHGSDSVYTVAWKTTRLGGMKASSYLFEDSYHDIARPFAASAKIRGLVDEQDHLYIAVHLRGPDDNTYLASSNAWDDPAMYCTMRVIRRLQALNITLITISNNNTWANEFLLGTSLRVRENANAYDDFSLLLKATAIVQHAWGGWSSYSSVPALASGAPIIATFRGFPHRHQLFHEQGGVPREMYNCRQRHKYMQAVQTLITS